MNQKHGELPTVEEYEYINMIAESYLDRAKSETDCALAISVTFPSPTGYLGSFKIHIYERNKPPDERGHWMYEGTPQELKRPLGDEE